MLSAKDILAREPREDAGDLAPASQTPPVLLHNSKERLLNRCAAALVHEPRFYATADSTRDAIYRDCLTVMQQDPEFILKLALYVRQCLQLRSTANYLLAIAANFTETQVFMRQYFNACTRLPADVQEVLTCYDALPHRSMAAGRYPACLRKSIVARFAAFPVYQLSKYGAEESNRRRRAKQETRKRKRGSETEAETEAEAETAASAAAMGPRRRQLTLKEMVRKFHVSQPKGLIMPLLGCQYPATAEAYAAAGLAGEWQASKAGQRMQLEAAMTWERLLSSGMDKRAAWEQLVSTHNLPFMAMLRNLRNILLADVSAATHEAILRRLTDQRQVQASRQLPFRFLAAYDVLQRLEQADGEADGSRSRSRGGKRQRGQRQRGQRSQRRQRSSPVCSQRAPESCSTLGDFVEAAARRSKNAAYYFAEAVAAEAEAEAAAAATAAAAQQAEESERAAAAAAADAAEPEPEPYRPPAELLARYRAALDRALQLSATNNVPALPGRTVLLVDVSGSMSSSISSKACRSSACTTLKDLAMLLALQLAYVSEECDVYVFSSPSYGSRGDRRCYRHVPRAELDPACILQNKAALERQAKELGGGTDFPFDVLKQLEASSSGRAPSTLICLSDQMMTQCMEQGYLGVQRAVDELRQRRNPRMLFVAMDFYGSGRAQCSMQEQAEQRQNLLVTGFSDSVLRYVAVRQTQQLADVEQAWERYGPREPRPARASGKVAADTAAATDAAATAEAADLDEEWVAV